MAIIPIVPGLDVTVNVNGQPLHEYDDDEVIETLGDNALTLIGKTASEYIEAVTDQEFSVVLAFDKEFKKSSPALSVHLTVDGEVLARRLISFSDPVHKLPFKIILSSTRTRSELGEYFRHNLRFTTLKTVVDDSLLGNISHAQERMSKIGKICVEVFRGGQPQLKVSAPKIREIRSGEISEVHEKALKGQAKSHGVSFGPARKIKASERYHTPKLDNGVPFAYFIFQYRSKEALKQLQIINRTPEPEELYSAMSSLPSIQSVQPAQRSVKTEAAGVKIEHGHVKRERNDEEEDIKPAKKQRQSQSKYKVKVSIDLTVDSDNEADNTIVLD